MIPRKVYIGFMSPTGGVKKVALALKAGFEHNQEQVDYSVFSFLSPLERQLVPAFADGDLLILCVPVFAGRMPKVLYEWQELQGHGAMAIAACIYGNRACDDATRELCDFLKARSFKVVGAAELIAEHSLERRLAHGRPDEADKTQLAAMAEQILSALGSDNLGELHFEAEGPYKPYSPSAVPELISIEACRKCHSCARICPAAIIDRESRSVPENLRDKCMGCLACVAHCQEKNRDLPPKVKEAVQARMQMVYEKNALPKANSLKLGLY